MPALSSEGYWLIAATFNTFLKNVATGPNDRRCILALANELAINLAVDNDRFNRDHFKKAILENIEYVNAR